MFGGIAAETTIHEARVVKLSGLCSFKDHPYPVKDDLPMRELVDTIQERGVIYLVLVRPALLAGMKSSSAIGGSVRVNFLRFLIRRVDAPFLSIFYHPRYCFIFGLSQQGLTRMSIRAAVRIGRIRHRGKARRRNGHNARRYGAMLCERSEEGVFSRIESGNVRKIYSMQFGCVS